MQTTRRLFFVDHTCFSTFISLQASYHRSKSRCACGRLRIFPSCGDEVLGDTFLCWVSPGTRTWNMALIQGWFCSGVFGFARFWGATGALERWTKNKDMREQTTHTAYRFTLTHITTHYPLWLHTRKAYQADGWCDHAVTLWHQLSPTLTVMVWKRW